MLTKLSVSSIGSNSRKLPPARFHCPFDFLLSVSSIGSNSRKRHPIKRSRGCMIPFSILNRIELAETTGGGTPALDIEFFQYPQSDRTRGNVIARCPIVRTLIFQYPQSDRTRGNLSCINHCHILITFSILNRIELAETFQAIPSVILRNLSVSSIGSNSRKHGGLP